MKDERRTCESNSRDSGEAVGPGFNDGIRFVNVRKNVTGRLCRTRDEVERGEREFLRLRVGLPLEVVRSFEIKISKDVRGPSARFKFWATIAIHLED